MPVIDDNIECAGKRYDEFFIPLISMSSTTLAPWDIVNPISPFNLKRNLFKVLGKREIASCVQKLWKLYNLTIINCHYSHSLFLKAKPRPSKRLSAGSYCLLTPFVIRYNLVPDSPASAMPFIIG